MVHPLQLALVVLFHPPTGANTALALGQLALCGGGLCGGGLCGGGLCGGGLSLSLSLSLYIYIYIYIYTNMKPYKNLILKTIGAPKNNRVRSHWSFFYLLRILAAAPCCLSVERPYTLKRPKSDGLFSLELCFQGRRL